MKAGEEEEWKKKTRDRGGEEVAGSTSPLTKGKRGRERLFAVGGGSDSERGGPGLMKWVRA